MATRADYAVRLVTLLAAREAMAPEVDRFRFPLFLCFFVSLRRLPIGRDLPITPLADCRKGSKDQRSKEDPLPTDYCRHILFP